MKTRQNIDARWIGVLCGLASAFVWAAFPVVTRMGLTHTTLDAYDITFIRYTVSGMILLPFLLNHGLRGLTWQAIVLLVFGIGAPYMLLVSFGLAQAPVEQFAIVTPGSMIVFSVLVTAWGFGTSFSRREKLGLALIIAGIALVGYRSFVSSQAPSYAYLIFLLGGLLWATYTVSSKHFSTSALHATAVVSVFSMLGYVPFYFAFRGTNLLQAPLWDLGVQAAYQGVLVSIVALFFYSKSVQLLGPAIGATFAALVPSAATLLAIPMLGEKTNFTTNIGLLTVTIGMVLTLLRQPQKTTIDTKN